MVRHARCVHQCTAGIRAAHARALLCWLSLGRRRSPLACRTRALCRAGYDPPMHRERAPHRREPSLLRCKTLVRHARCGHRCTAGIHAAHARAPLRWLSLGRRRITRASRSRVLRRAGCDLSMHQKTMQCTGGNPLSFGAIPWRDVPAAAPMHSLVAHGTRASATAMAVYRETGRHARKPRACAVPHRLRSVYDL